MVNTVLRAAHPAPVILALRRGVFCAGRRRKRRSGGQASFGLDMNLPRLTGVAIRSLLRIARITEESRQIDLGAFRRPVLCLT
jgi:hypothetical protein